MKPKLARPGRVPVTACAWDREGKRIVGGVGDGSIQVDTLRTSWLSVCSQTIICIDALQSEYKLQVIFGLRFFLTGCKCFKIK